MHNFKYHKCDKLQRFEPKKSRQLLLSRSGTDGNVLSILFPQNGNYVSHISHPDRSTIGRVVCSEENIVSSTMHFEHTIDANALEHIDSDMCSTPMPPNAEKKGKSISTNATRPLIPMVERTMVTFNLSDTESEMESPDDTDPDNDEEVQILEWNPGTDVKPVIKMELDCN